MEVVSHLQQWQHVRHTEALRDYSQILPENIKLSF